MPIRELYREYSTLSNVFCFYLVGKELLNEHSSYLAEILSVLGPDNTVKFLQAFSGATIQLPSSETIKECAEDVTLWRDVIRNKNEDFSHRDSIANVARKFQCPDRKVVSAYNKVERFLRRWDTLLAEGVHDIFVPPE